MTVSTMTTSMDNLGTIRNYSTWAVRFIVLQHPVSEIRGQVKLTNMILAQTTVV